MSFLGELYNLVFYQPLYNILVFLTGVVPYSDIGIAIVILTVIVKFILFPLSHKSIKTQAKLRELEPEIKDIKEKYGKDSSKQAKKVMELYKQHGVNPFSGCLMMLIQLPIIFALYKLFLGGFEFDAINLYSFVSLPQNIKMEFLSTFDLAEKSIYLAALAGISQYFQIKLAIPPIKEKSKGGESSFKEDFAKGMNVQMRYVMPVFVFFFSFSISSAIALYWTTMNLFGIVHEMTVRSKAKKIIEQNGKPERDNKINSKGASGEDGSSRGS